MEHTVYGLCVVACMGLSSSLHWLDLKQNSVVFISLVFVAVYMCVRMCVVCVCNDACCPVPSQP